MFKLLFLLYFVVYPTTSFASGDVGVVDMSEMVSQKKACREKRLDKNLLKMDVTRDAIKGEEFEDECESKINFCFTFRTLKQTKIDGYVVPAKSNVYYCEKEGLRTIDANDISPIEKDGLSCTGHVSFEGQPSQICSCVTLKNFTIHPKKEGKIIPLSVSIGSTLFFKGGEVKYFQPSMSIPFGGLQLEKGKLYEASGGKIEKSSLALSHVCQENRQPDEGVLKAVLEPIGIDKTEVKDLTYGAGCDDSPTEYDGQIVEYIGLRLAKEIKKELVSAPKESYVSFCDGALNSIKTGDQEEIKFYGHSCRMEVQGWKMPKGKVYYSCELLSSEMYEGVNISKGANIVFDKNGMKCITNYKPGSEVFAGNTPIKEGYYFIDNGAVVKKDKCY